MQLDNVVGPIRFQSQGSGDHVAIVQGGRALSYRELWHEIERFAALFGHIGVQPHERVGIFLENRPEAVIASLAAAAIGAIAVPMNWMLKPAQVQYILSHSDTRCLVTSFARLQVLAPMLEHAAPRIQVVSVDRLGSEIGGNMRTHLAPEFDTRGAGLPERAATIDEDAGLILYTSGSTGQPKGVLLSHRNLIQGACAVASYLRMGRDDRVLCAIPLGFDAGFNQVTSTLYSGGMVVLHNYTRPIEAVRCCEAFKVTGTTGVPPFWMDVGSVEWPEPTRRRLRYFATTGGPMPQPTLQRLRQLFANAEPYLMYGLTEAYRSTYLEPALVDERPGSIGKAIPNARISVRRADGTPCEPREIGELVHTGATVGLGYWNDPEATAKRFRSVEVECGGLRRRLPAVWSGDLAWQDEDGFLYFVGRNDAMIKTCGCRVSPTEVEEVVLASGLAREVVAVGLPDERRGQIIGIALAAAGDRPDEQTLRRDLLRHCRNTAPSYMVPELVVVAEALPRTPNGKFDREQCAAMLTGLLQAQVQ